MTTETRTLDDEVKEIREKHDAQISSLRDELAGIDPYFNGFPKDATEQEIAIIRDRVVFLKAEIERLKKVEIEEIRALYRENKALAKTLRGLSRLRGQKLTEVKSRYFRCGGWAKEEDGSWGAYFCENCGWVADTRYLDSFGYDCCRICGS